MFLRHSTRNNDTPITIYTPFSHLERGTPLFSDVQFAFAFIASGLILTQVNKVTETRVNVRKLQIGHSI